MAYNLHPSQVLVDLFRLKPYQGAAPEKAKYLSIGLDANYGPDIEQQAVFRRILEYHDDGVAFWLTYGVHHPFLLPEYSGEGRFYHKSFAKIGFTPDHAPEVSFIELLHLPTTGRNQLAVTDLDAQHLARINDSILNGQARHIFVSSSAARLMKSTKKFPWLPAKPTAERVGLKTYYQAQGKTVYLHLHFSNYGKFEARKQEEAKVISGLIESCRKKPSLITKIRKF